MIKSSASVEEDEEVDTYLLPVLLQRRHGGEVAGVVDQLKFLKDAVVRQDIHR